MTFRVPTYQSALKALFYDLDYLLNWNNRSKVKTQTSDADLGAVNASQAIQVGGCC